MDNLSIQMDNLDITHHTVPFWIKICRLILLKI